MQEAINAAEARCRKRGEFMRLFSTNVGTTAPEGMATPYLEHFDLPVDITGDAKLGLPELLDNLLWDTSESAESNNNYIQRDAGHGLTLHYSAVEGYAYIQDFVRRSGL